MFVADAFFLVPTEAAGVVCQDNVEAAQPGVIDQLSENVAFIHAPATDEFDVKRIAEGQAV